ncbi:2,3-bisphosphoglycerate-independent phosphoglycerate mutase [Pseudoflavonifractor sp. DSM 107456]|uniref:2,3-bisphosphoglycerate-independent phosphoglycerate mutase n=2 Tax=Pseudoflavonifractor TaxID=1017280 RepID=A0ABR9RAQ4_9FIRM|nr:MULTISPECIES: 2,3-bisphosphoglycerate-independent phosphoglycerate mutase [Eubacteriales]MBC5730563.1 2,3-bisphosphoglycerate-independent phosphoglycerate mutase [Pseudoflavonifractor hominis]MBE5055648.1 2,3-bisphosphoglycerate-independent phosphoglycerate mutase [Pseudoflavonifractor gallinarum]MBS5133832.1 2,3-bisphosphoglycerate-independent phosphoglycerate mutase [Oscillospiraceae bacterium]MBT9684347.1 2,3-bisphosphoglycerate-independent phosphoglycerate mutase [Pseudoflavonifractor sp
MSKTPTTLIIMDGFGLTDVEKGNAITNARTPNLDRIFASCPGCKLSASGLDVGLPEGQMGNSEVGHTNIGAGRVVFQDLPRITKAIQDGSFFENTAYLEAMGDCKERNSALHLMGLLSDGGVHSHITHLFALLEMAKRQGLSKVYIHCFLDGRDVPPASGKGYVEQLVAKCKELGIGQVATVMGRFYAMDRDKRWERVQRAYNAMANGDAPFCADPVEAVQKSYDAGVTDEFVEPVVCTKGATVNEGDSIIFFNFRPDRAREITRCFVDSAFGDVERKRGFLPVTYVCTTEYDATMPNVSVAFPHKELQNIFGEYISKLGLTQLRIAETEKYAHVTFFFNGGAEQVFPGEDRVLIASPKVATYDLKPDMSAHEVADEAVKRIESGNYDVIILNFANCDMVGHTGVYEAARLAVEAVDECVNQVVEATSRMGGVTLITADHGNAERMLDADGSTPYTAHTTNLVPFYIVGADVKLRDGRLADIAPTMLDLMGLEKPAEMDGETLIEN